MLRTRQGAVEPWLRLLGRRLRVYWAGEKRWFCGEVRAGRWYDYDRSTPEMQIRYDDGECRWHRLDEEVYRWLDVGNASEASAAGAAVGQTVVKRTRAPAFKGSPAEEVVGKGCEAPRELGGTLVAFQEHKKRAVDAATPAVTVEGRKTQRRRRHSSGDSSGTTPGPHKLRRAPQRALVKGRALVIKVEGEALPAADCSHRGSVEGEGQPAADCSHRSAHALGGAAGSHKVSGAHQLVETSCAEYEVRISWCVDPAGMASTWPQALPTRAPHPSQLGFSTPTHPIQSPLPTVIQAADPMTHTICISYLRL